MIETNESSILNKLNNQIMNMSIQNVNNEISKIMHLIYPLTKLLEDAELYENLEYTQQITRNCYNLMRNNMLLNTYYDLINNSRQNFTSCFINDFLNDFYVAIKPLMDHAGYNLTLTLCDKTIISSIDMEYLLLALTNIMANACLYSPIDTDVNIALSHFNNTFTITIKDKGYGMGKKVKERAFEPFYSFDPNNIQKRLGLGLSIAKKVVEIHNGEIIIDSVLDKGTSIGIKVPITNVLSESLYVKSPKNTVMLFQNNGASTIAIAFSEIYIIRGI